MQHKETKRKLLRAISSWFAMASGISITQARLPRQTHCCPVVLPVARSGHQPCVSSPPLLVSSLGSPPPASSCNTMDTTWSWDSSNIATNRLISRATLHWSCERKLRSVAGQCTFSTSCHARCSFNLCSAFTHCQGSSRIEEAFHLLLGDEPVHRGPKRRFTGQSTRSDSEWALNCVSF